MKTLQFTKMQGAGNDFVVLNAIEHGIDITATLSQRLADRRFGVGCDQILIVERPDLAENDFKYRIFNADGTEVEQCGNGARCFARFVREKGLTDKDVIQVETKGGVIVPHITDMGVKVDMGAPRLAPHTIPFKADSQRSAYALTVEGQSYTVGAVSMGNPHVVLQVDDVQNGLFEALGPKFETHPDFPEKANAGFMQVIAKDHIKLRVYERGVGETLACGTGACAAVVYGILTGVLDEQVAVDLPGGRLHIAWAGVGQPVYQTGPADFVFEGQFLL